jgi:hypothetical protein
VPDGASAYAAAREAADDLRWSAAYDLLRHLDVDDLEPETLELYADAAWWCCHVEEEIGVRQRAFADYVAAGDHRRAAYNAWLLSVRHGLRGEPDSASGWLGRARRQLDGQPESIEHGYVACGEAEAALGSGDLDLAESRARDAVDIGVRLQAPELVALAVSWQGLTRLARNELGQGLALLDEAMASVTAGELDAHFTGLGGVLRRRDVHGRRRPAPGRLLGPGRVGLGVLPARGHARTRACAGSGRWR